MFILNVVKASNNAANVCKSHPWEQKPQISDCCEHFQQFFLLAAQAFVNSCRISLYGHLLQAGYWSVYITYTATCSYVLISGKPVILVAVVVNVSPVSDHIPAGTCFWLVWFFTVESGAILNYSHSNATCSYMLTSRKPLIFVADVVYFSPILDHVDNNTWIQNSLHLLPFMLPCLVVQEPALCHSDSAGQTGSLGPASVTAATPPTLQKTTHALILITFDYYISTFT